MRLYLHGLFVVLLEMFFTSCRSYCDVQANSFSNKDMSFQFGDYYNRIDYYGRMNSRLDKEVYFTTHYTIDLPKGIVDWQVNSMREFYFRYPSNQVIYIYTAYKNVGKESNEWVMKDDYGKGVFNPVRLYLFADAGCIDCTPNEGRGRLFKVYTNGKYNIFLYNIKKSNFSLFVDYVKTFRIK